MICAMNNLLLIPMATALVGGLAFGQGYDQDKMKANYEKKIAKEFVSSGGWLLDYDEARAKAKAEDKLIFAYFSRSYSP
jgi:hypothetical protein